MPYFPLDRATNFIVEDESWHTIETDFTSVPGTIYVSLTENKVNYIYDDLVNDIADTDKRAQYKIATPSEPQTCTVGDTIVPAYTIMKDGRPLKDAKIEYISQNNAVVKVENTELIAVGEGTAAIKIRLLDVPDSDDVKDKLEFPINVIGTSTDAHYYIEGPTTVRLAQEEYYQLVAVNTQLPDNSEIDWTVVYNGCPLSDMADYKRVALPLKEEEIGETYNRGQIKVRMNQKNNLCSFKLVASILGEPVAETTIDIKPLW